jgi:WD40 repeat protein
VATIVAIGLTVFAFNQRGLAQNSAEAAQAEADARATQQSIAEAAQEEAVIQASLALEAQQEAENQAEIAAANEAEALAQKAIVVAQAEAAQRQADINQSRFLAAQSQLALNGDLRDLAVALARAAVNIEDPPGEAQTALSEAAYAPGIYRLFSVSSDQFLVARYRPDRKTLISISEDLAIQHWDIQTGILLRSIEIQVHPRQSYLLSHEHYLEERIFYLPDWSKSVDLSPDGTRALIGLSDLSLALVDVDTGEILKLMKGHTILIGVAVFSPDGRWALSSSYPGHGVSPGPGSDLSMRLWDLETGLEVRRFNGHADWISALAFSPDGKTAISGSIDETAIYWDLESGEPLQHMVNPSDPVEERYVNAAVFSPNGKLALISQWWSANLWDLDTGELIRAYEGHNQTIRELAFSPDGTLGVSGHGGEVWVFDIETGKVLEYFQHRGVAKDLIFNADGRSIIVAGADVYIFQLNQGPEIARFEVAAAMPASGVPDATYSPDGRKILATSVDGPLYYWDLESQQEILRIELPFRAREVAFTPNGDSALVTFWDGNVILFDLTSGAEIMRLGGDDNPLRHQDIVDAVAISPDGTKALTGAQVDPPLIMWDLTTGEPIMELPSDMVFAVAFSPNGKTVLSAGFDLILWDAATGEMIRKLDNKDDANGHSNFIWDVVYSPDGTRALTGSWDATLILWDLETGEIIHQLLGHSDIVRAVAIHPDGRLAVSGSRDGTLIMWDLETGEAIRRIHAHNEVNSVEFSPDGQTILSGGFDLMVVVWRVDETLEDLIAWTDANRYIPELTCAERALYNVEPLCEAGE